MIESIEKLDQELFLKLNSFHSPLWDDIMWFISGKVEWIPLYVVLLVLVILKYKKQSVWIFLGVIALITLSDQISVQVFKEGFERYRPCHNLEIKELVHLVNNKCGGKFGFVSSHASNAFALATFIGLVLRRKEGLSASLPLLIVWAMLVSYSRVYLGVHYPLDIIGGGILGILISLGVYYTLEKFIFSKNREA